MLSGFIAIPKGQSLIEIFEMIVPAIASIVDIVLFSWDIMYNCWLWGNDNILYGIIYLRSIFFKEFVSLMTEINGLCRCVTYINPSSEL